MQYQSLLVKCAYHSANPCWWVAFRDQADVLCSVHPNNCHSIRPHPAHSSEVILSEIKQVYLVHPVLHPVPCPNLTCPWIEWAPATLHIEDCSSLSNLHTKELLQDLECQPIEKIGCTKLDFKKIRFLRLYTLEFFRCIGWLHTFGYLIKASLGYGSTLASLPSP